jgi:hypothetical protein
MRPGYLLSTHVMSALFCQVLVTLRTLLIKDLKYCGLGAYRPRGHRFYYRDDLTTLIYVRTKLRVLGRQSIHCAHTRWCEIW